jgi:hypothetical protein
MELLGERSCPQLFALLVGIAGFAGWCQQLPAGMFEAFADCSIHGAILQSKHQGDRKRRTVRLSDSSRAE